MNKLCLAVFVTSTFYTGSLAAQSLSIVQTGRANVYGLVQVGPSASVTIRQSGTANMTGIIQAGPRNLVGVTQSGAMNRAYTGQYSGSGLYSARGMMP